MRRFAGRRALSVRSGSVAGSSASASASSASSSASSATTATTATATATTATSAATAAVATAPDRRQDDALRRFGGACGKARAKGRTVVVLVHARERLRATRVRHARGTLRSGVAELALERTRRRASSGVARRAGRGGGSRRSARDGKAGKRKSHQESRARSMGLGKAAPSPLWMAALHRRYVVLPCQRGVQLLRRGGRERFDLRCSVTFSLAEEKCRGHRPTAGPWRPAPRRGSSRSGSGRRSCC
jgi:hypothetical protein